MKLSGNTILITGGSSGIGLELATQLLALGNTVIVTGREQSKLEAARGKFPQLKTIRSDVGEPSAIASLHQRVISEFPDLNVLVNNAGIMRKINLQLPAPSLEDVTRELRVNLDGCVWMVTQFLPHLKAQQHAAIVNVSSALAFVPLPISPVYSASKAAVHSFTQSLRLQLKNTHIKVFELAPPGTDTALYEDFTGADLIGINRTDVSTLVRHALAGIAADVPEIRPGTSNVLKLMSRVAPDFILGKLGRSVDVMLSDKRASDIGNKPLRH